MAKYKLQSSGKVYEIYMFCSELIIVLALSEIVNNLKKKEEEKYDRQRYDKLFDSTLDIWLFAISK